MFGVGRGEKARKLVEMVIVFSWVVSLENFFCMGGLFGRFSYGFT